MPPAPRYIVQRSDGGEAAELFDLPAHALVCLHVEDHELARLLQERGIMTPRPPYLDAVNGGYAPRPQVNWFLAPPIEGVASALGEALGATRAGYVIVPVAPAVPDRPSGPGLPGTSPPGPYS
jgi:hypothetical protein